MIEMISPPWIGIGISGSLIVILLVTETALGRWDVLLTEGEFGALASFSNRVLRDIRLAIVLSLLMGYLPAAVLHVIRNGRRTVLVLQGALDCNREECEMLAASIRPQRAWPRDHRVNRFRAGVCSTVDGATRGAGTLEPVGLESRSRVAPHPLTSDFSVAIVVRLRRRHRLNTHVACCEETEPHRPTRPYAAGGITLVVTALAVVSWGIGIVAEEIVGGAL